MEKIGKLNETAINERTQPLVQLGSSIQTLKEEYLKSLIEVDEIKDALAHYVESEGQESAYATSRFALMDKVITFLASEKKVLLLLGEAGAGKSTFNRFLARVLWEVYKQNTTQPVPLFIALAECDTSGGDLIEKYLLKNKFDKETIQALRQHQRFIFILDGLDEIDDPRQEFYTSNQLDQWHAQTIISARPEYLKANYQSQFQKRGQTNTLQEYWFAPISDHWVHRYISKFVENLGLDSSVVTFYQEVLNGLPTLKEAIRRPFLLRMALEVLPKLGKESGNARMIRLALYEAFVKHWWSRSEERLSHITLTEEEKAAWLDLEPHFTAKGLRASQKMAIALTQAKTIFAKYDAEHEWASPPAWRQYLYKPNTKDRLIFFNAPLTRHGQQYHFIHKSLQDYFVARNIWTEQLTEDHPPQVGAALNQLSIVDEPLILDFLSERLHAQPVFKAYLHRWITASKTQPDLQQGAANAITTLVKAGEQFNGADLSGVRIEGADLSYGLFDHAQFVGADLKRVNFEGAWLREADLRGAQMECVRFGENPALLFTDPVWSCCYSQDGKWMAVVVNYGAKLYDAHTLELIRTFKLPGNNADADKYGFVESIAISPNGNMLAMAMCERIFSSHVITLWSTDNETTSLKTFKGHTKRVVSMAFSPDSKILVSASHDETIKLWSLDDEVSLLKSLRNDRRVNSVAFSPNGKMLAWGGECCTVKLCLMDGDTHLVKTLRGHTQYVNSVAFSPQGNMLASGSSDGTIKLWLIEHQEFLLKTLEGHTEEVTSVVFSPDGKVLASGGWDCTVKLWSMGEEKTLLKNFEGHTKAVTSVAFSRGGSMLISGSGDKTLKLWLVDSEMRLKKTKNISKKFSIDGNFLTLGDGDFTFEQWSGRSLSSREFFKAHPNLIDNAVVSPDGKTFACQGKYCFIQLRSVEGEMPILKNFRGHTGSVHSFAFSPNGKILASGSEDHTVKLWSLDSEPHLLKTLEGHNKSVAIVTFSPDGKMLASGSDDQTIRLWSVESKPHLLKTLWLRGDVSLFRGIFFSPDGKILVSVSGGQTIRLWSVDSGRLLATLSGYGGINEIVWKADTEEYWLITLSKGHRVCHLWQLQQESERLRVILRWASIQTMFNASGTLIDDVQGLNEMDIELLKQRGAIVKPLLPNGAGQNKSCLIQ